MGRKQQIINSKQALLETTPQTSNTEWARQRSTRALFVNIFILIVIFLMVTYSTVRILFLMRHVRHGLTSGYLFATIQSKGA